MLRFWRKWLRARMTLGWALVKHLLMGPFASARADPRRWLNRMAQENLGATPPESWARAERASRCIGCGLCDIFGTAELPRPSQLIAGGARMPSDALLWVRDAQLLGGMRQSILSVCPTQVDVSDVVALLEGHAAMLQARTGQRD